jgi:uncharacterized protein (DUF427 family)
MLATHRAPVQPKEDIIPGQGNTERRVVPRATLNGVTLAESDHTEIVEGNHYFPPGSVNRDLFRESATSTHCPWKGDASHLSVEVDGTRVEDAAWYYTRSPCGRPRT